MSQLRAYKSLDECPIWNWEQITKKNDVRYLFIMDYYSDLPRITKLKHQQLTRFYAAMLMQLDLSTPLTQAKKKVNVRVLDLILLVAKQSKSAKKIEKASIILRGLLITNDPDESWLFNVDFAETPDQKQAITQLAVEIKRYQEKSKRQKSTKPQTLFQQIVRIESILQVSIDAKKCSVTQFMEYKKEARTKSNMINKITN